MKINKELVDRLTKATDINELEWKIEGDGYCVVRNNITIHILREPESRTNVIAVQTNYEYGLTPHYVEGGMVCLIESIKRFFDRETSKDLKLFLQGLL